MKRLNHPGVLAFLAMLLSVGPASAETWIDAGGSDLGHMWVDRDSITRASDGLAHYHAKNDLIPEIINEAKVDCTQDFSAEQIRFASRQLTNHKGEPKKNPKWMVSDDLYVSSMAGQGAKYACGVLNAP